MLVGTKGYLESEVRENNGTEVSLLLQFLLITTPHFVPGMRWLPDAHPGLIFGYAALMLGSAMACAFACFLRARRDAFTSAGRLAWALCGLLWGPAGLLLMLALHECPARIACPKCGKFRVVTRDTCEYCGALHALPAPDGTEIFEPTPATPHAILAAR